MRAPAAATLLLAVLLPAALVLLWAWGLARPWPDAGPSPEARRYDAVVDEQAPFRVLVLGNSAARRAVDPDALGRSLGVPGEVLLLPVPGSFSASWYAVLRHRVLARGHTPDLVVVVGTLQHLLATDHTPEPRRRLLHALAGDDPEIAARVLTPGGTWPPLARARARMEDALDRLKYAAVGATFPTPDLPLVEGGQAVADPALQELFDLEAQVDMALGRSRMPFGVDPAEVRGLSRETFDPAEGFTLDLVRLARDHDVRVALARLPWPPDASPSAVPTDHERALLDGLGRAGAAWIDLSGLDLPSSAWFDPVHLNAGGRAVVTAALGDRLAALDALGGTPFPEPRVPLRIGPATGHGTAPARKLEARPLRGPCAHAIAAPDLGALSDATLQARLGLVGASPLGLSFGDRTLAPHQPGTRCDDGFLHTPQGFVARPLPPLPTGPVTVSWPSPGAHEVSGPDGPRQVWVVPPGTEVRVPVHDAWAPDPPRITVRGVASEAPGVPLVRVDTTAIQLAPSDGRLVAHLHAPPTSGPWTLAVASPVDGPGLVLTDLVLGEGEEATRILGRRTAWRGGSAVWLGTRTDPPWRVQGTAPRWTPPPVEPEDGTRAWDVPDLVPLTDHDLERRVGAHDCGPLRVFADGAPLDTVPWDEVAQEPGRAAHRGRRVTASVSAGASVRFGLDPARRCGPHARWLYAGDRATQVAPIPPGLLAPARAVELVLTAVSPPDATGAVQVRITHDGTVHADVALAADRLRDGRHVLPLDPPLPTDAAEATLTLRSAPDAPHAVLGRVTLRERPVAPSIDLDLPLALDGPQAWQAAWPEGTPAGVAAVDGVLVLHADTPVPVRACSPWVDADGDRRAEAEVEVRRLTPGRRPWQTARLETLWRDADGMPARGADGRPIVQSRPLDAVTDGVTAVRWAASRPPTGDEVRVCVRLARATGEVAVHRVRLAR